MRDSKKLTMELWATLLEAACKTALCTDFTKKVRDISITVTLLFRRQGQWKSWII